MFHTYLGYLLVSKQTLKVADAIFVQSGHPVSM